MIIDRRKLKLSTDVSVGRYLDRRKRIANNEVVDNLLGGVDRLQLFIPQFVFSRGAGTQDHIVTGNDQYIRGDEIKRDAWEEYLSRVAAGNTEDGSDDFEYTPTELEYLEQLFSGLDLPNLTKKSIESEDYEIVRCGYSTAGGIVDLKKTFRSSIGRRAAAENGLRESLTGIELEEELKKIPFLDDRDVRYRRYDKVVTPSKKMVMFLLMDVSGSMGEYEKRLAKLFSNLVIEFLSRKYDKCVIEYITFTESAERVSRQEFFHGRRSGGNMLYTALELQKQIMAQEYPNDWNVYNMIFSDSGFYDDDIDVSQGLLTNMLSYLQYSVYIHIGDRNNEDWETFAEPYENVPAFGTADIVDDSDIVDAFLEVFKK